AASGEPGRACEDQGHAFALQDRVEVRERPPAVGDKVDGTGEQSSQERCGDRAGAEDRARWAVSWISLEGALEACPLKRGQPRGQRPREVELDLAHVCLSRP